MRTSVETPVPPRKVALITSKLSLGGTTTFMLAMCAGIQRLGGEPAVFSFTGAHACIDEFTHRGFAVHLENERRLTYEDRMAGLWRKLRGFAPDAVIAVLGFESFELMRYLPEGVRRIGVIHDRIMEPDRLARLYHPFLDLVVVHADHVQNMLSRNHPRLRCERFDYGALLPGDVPPRSPNSDKPLRLVYYGRLDDNPKQVRIFPASRLRCIREAFRSGGRFTDLAWMHPGCIGRWQDGHQTGL